MYATCSQFFLYLFMSAAFAYMMQGKRDKVHDCDEDLSDFLTYNVYYFVFVALRNFILLIILPITKNP